MSSDNTTQRNASQLRRSKRPKMSDTSDESVASKERVERVVVSEDSDRAFDTTIEALDDFFLVKLFSLFNIREKLAIERVCKRWQTIVLDLTAKQTGLGTTWSADEDSNCLLWRREHCVTGGDIREAIVMNNGWFYDFTDVLSLKRLAVIFRKCPNVKCLHVTHSIIDSVSFRAILDFNPGIECVHLKSVTLKGVGPCTEDNHQNSPNEWRKIGEVIGSRVKHLSLNPHYEHRMSEDDAKQFLTHFSALQEFRVGTHFEREVIGKFVSYLPKTCKLFYSLGREFSKEALSSLIKNQKEVLTHLTFFSHPLMSAEVLKTIGDSFENLRRLRVNLSYNEIILSSQSPISKLTHLLEFSVDLNTFSDSNVDDGLIWCIKDGLPSVKCLEITRACLSPRTFNSIQWCLPLLQKLVLVSVEIQCFCDSEEILERCERYYCTVCRKKGWKSIAQLKHLTELHLSNPFYRQDKPKVFHNELCDVLPEFNCLNMLYVFRYDISGAQLFEALNKMLSERQTEDICSLKLRSVAVDLERKVLNKKLVVIYDPWML